MSTIYVAGSINQDVVVTMDRTPGPGETVVADGLEYFQGGKGANQAVSARKLGAEVRYSGCIGTDAFGTALGEEMRKHGLEAGLRAVPGWPTGTALIMVDARGENSIAVVLGANEALAPDACDLSGAGRGDVLLLQHETPRATNHVLIQRARSMGLRTIVNAAPAASYRPEEIAELDILMVNEHELSVVFNEKKSWKGAQDALSVVRRLAETSRVNIILTLGAAGAVASIDGEVHLVPGFPVDAVDTTGAGDCFAGAFVAGMSFGWGASKALTFAAHAAAISVTRPGAAASFPTLAEVQATYGSG